MTTLCVKDGVAKTCVKDVTKMCVKDGCDQDVCERSHALALLFSLALAALVSGESQ